MPPYKVYYRNGANKKLIETVNNLSSVGAFKYVLYRLEVVEEVEK